MPANDFLDAAAHELSSGGIVAVPSETSYMLLADTRHTGASDRLFQLTKRQRTFELTMFVCDAAQAMSVSTALTPAAQKLMDKFWPGPLSLVLPRNPEFTGDLGSDDETVGVRCPAHIAPRLLCERLGPLASVAAGFHGEPPLLDAQSVAQTFGEQIALVLDAGPVSGARTTAIDATGADVKILHEGSISQADVQSVVE